MFNFDKFIVYLLFFDVSLVISFYFSLQRDSQLLVRIISGFRMFNVQLLHKEIKNLISRSTKYFTLKFHKVF